MNAKSLTAKQFDQLKSLKVITLCSLFVVVLFFYFATQQIAVCSNKIIHRVLDKVELKVVSSRKGECGREISKKPTSV